MEGFHLTGAAHCQGIVVQDTESCNQVVGCPECGVIAQGHGRVVVEMIDALWVGTRTRVRWDNTALVLPRKRLLEGDVRGAQYARVCPQDACRCAGNSVSDPSVALFGSHHRMSGPPAKHGRNTVWSSIKSLFQAAADDPDRFAGVRALGVDEHV